MGQYVQSIESNAGHTRDKANTDKFEQCGCITTETTEETHRGEWSQPRYETNAILPAPILLVVTYKTITNKTSVRVHRSNRKKKRKVHHVVSLFTLHYITLHYILCAHAQTNSTIPNTTHGGYIADETTAETTPWFVAIPTK